MAKAYRRKTNWVPQEERDFTLTDQRPERLDFDRLKDLFLVAALTDGSQVVLDGPARRRLSPGTRLASPQARRQEPV